MPRRPRSNSGGNTKKPPTAALQVVTPAEVVVLEEHRDLVSAVVAGAPWLQPSDRILVEQLRLLVGVQEQLLPEVLTDRQARLDFMNISRQIAGLCSQLGLEALSRYRIGQMHADQQERLSTMERLRAQTKW